MLTGSCIVPPHKDVGVGEGPIVHFSFDEFPAAAHATTTRLPGGRSAPHYYSWRRHGARHAPRTRRRHSFGVLRVARHLPRNADLGNRVSTWCVGRLRALGARVRG